ncbi:SIR2 family protein [Bacillus toyonensis]|uniref:SIR2 family protein n=1 Tax=Bacillus TaxID=1386 RepID=UPI000304437E|nr:MULTISPECIES: SIR2 family protein [Bacillus]MBY7135729.1 SIR2 family protein [Bacillus sp. 12RED03]HDR7537256.1 SIR2 family protein [Bacillus toyonensis]
MSESEAVENINSFLKEFRFIKFSSDSPFPNFSEMVLAMKELDLIREYFNYTCLRYDKTENANVMMTTCVHCGNNISVVNGNHEIKHMFQINKAKTLILVEELNSRREKEMLDHYLIEDYFVNLEQLRKRKENLIPFMGSGLSVPFNLPNWKGMLNGFSRHLKKGYEGYYNDKLNEGDYFEALSYLKKSSFLSKDELIQEQIVDIFNEKIKMNIEKDDHNYLDVLDLNSDFYLTTNYDNIFSTIRGSFHPPLMWNDIENMQKFLGEKKQSIVHLHGMIHKPKTMIVTKESYDGLYQDEDFMRIISTFMSNKSFIFLGFSFHDVYFKDLYEKIISKTGGEHFIILPNISYSDALTFSKQNLKVVGINVKKSDDGIDGEDLVKGIKTILNYINNDTK